MIDTRVYEGELGKELPFESVRDIQLGLLDALVSFCEEHSLRYYISGGTLLGAVRHGGYIPWDDDIDVNMPRPDCDRLLELTGGRLNGHIEIGAFDGPITHSVPFIRLYDTDYVMRLESETGKLRSYSNVSIDLFPIDGLPKSERLSRFHYFLAKSCVVMRRLAFYRGLTGKWDWHRYIRFFSTLPAKLVGWKNWNRLIQKISRKYGYEKSEKVGVVCCCVHTNTERMPKEWYGEAKELSFEGRTLRAPNNYEGYLKNIYGDYMKLPPEEKRIRKHHYRVYSAGSAGQPG